jgi:hypothetical protein
MKRTYVDTGVLIAAARGKAPIAIKALDILDDPDREFASSIFVKLEVLPKAVYYKSQAEIEFYQIFFDRVIHWADALESIVEDAYQEACTFGLAAVDALHVAAAKSVGATELVTSERPGKPIHRTSSITVVSIWSED